MIQRPDLDQKYVGTCFDRQVRIQSWDQDKLKSQTALILGVGGLGSVVMMNLLRLGIKKLILLDNDVVDIHNLNRQLMFTPGDIGEPKVESAKKNARFHNVADTEIETFHGNALTNWQKVIQFCNNSDVVFNCIDYGDKFDLAVSSVCMKIGLPLIMGGGFSTMFTVDYINPKGVPCFLCLNQQTGKQAELLQKLNPDKVLQLTDISFLPKNDNPISRTSVIVCTICGQLMVSHFLNYLFLHQTPPYKTARLVGYHNTFEIINFEIQVVKKCPFCGDPNYVEPKEENKAQDKEDKEDKEQVQKQSEHQESKNSKEQKQEKEQIVVQQKVQKPEQVKEEAENEKKQIQTQKQQ